MIFIFLFLYLLPQKESIVYRTDDTGKIGTRDVTAQKDSLGLHVIYEWEDRILEVIFDTMDMSTVYVKKTIADKIVLEITREDEFKVYFKGDRVNHPLEDPIYDRHALEFALRGFKYDEDFKKTIRFHVPEFMVIRADLEVIGDDVVSCPLGEIQCWKLMMTPRVLFIKWKFYFWIEKDYPHRFIKYEDSSAKNSILLIEYNN